MRKQKTIWIGFSQHAFDAEISKNKDEETMRIGFVNIDGKPCAITYAANSFQDMITLKRQKEFSDLFIMGKHALDAVTAETALNDTSLTLDKTDLFQIVNKSDAQIAAAIHNTYALKQQSQAQLKELLAAPDIDAAAHSLMFEGDYKQKRIDLTRMMSSEQNPDMSAFIHTCTKVAEANKPVSGSNLTAPEVQVRALNTAARMQSFSARHKIVTEYFQNVVLAAQSNPYRAYINTNEVSGTTPEGP